MKICISSCSQCFAKTVDYDYNMIYCYFLGDLNNPNENMSRSDPNSLMNTVHKDCPFKTDSEINVELYLRNNK